MGYVDFAYFPWPKYQISEASWAVEPFISVKWQQKKFGATCYAINVG